MNSNTNIELSKQTYKPQIIPIAKYNNCNNNCLMIGGEKGTMVTINLNTGKVTFDENYNLDETAKTFWKSICAYRTKQNDD